MNNLVSLPIVCLFVAGCQPSSEQLAYATDEKNLRLYTNIPSGTLVRVRTQGTRFDYTKSKEPIVSPSLVTSYYIFDRVSFGTIELRSTNDPAGKVIRFAGRMIESVTPIETNATVR
jgi:hypothetical protein